MGMSVTEVVSSVEGISARTDETIYVDEVSRLRLGLGADKQRAAPEMDLELSQ